jgi:hypothetical protein
MQHSEASVRDWFTQALSKKGQQKEKKSFLHETFFALSALSLPNENFMLS